MYRPIRSDEGPRSELWRHLPSGRRPRRGYRLRKRPPPRFAPELSILFRPDVSAHRQEFGAADVSTLLERVSRFLVVLKDPEKRAKPIMAQRAKALGPLPPKARRSMTFDRGAECVNWLQVRTDAQTRVCDARSPWQKGAIEQANTRPPRDTDPGGLGQEDRRQPCAALKETRANASASERPPKSSAPTSWPAGIEQRNDPTNQSRIQGSASSGGTRDRHASFEQNGDVSRARAPCRVGADALDRWRRVTGQDPMNRRLASTAML